MRLLDKTVVVTGAARGIGRACAIRCAEEGADLVLFDIADDLTAVPYPLGTGEELAETARRCRKQGAGVLPIAGDVRDQSAVDAMARQALDRFGRVDVLINNAGIVAPSGSPVERITQDEWSVMLDINLSGAWHVMKAIAPGMLGRRGGSIVNISSTAGLVGYRHFAGYVAAKHGVIGLTKAAALDYAPHRVRVNAICPGSVHDDPDLGGRMLSEIARSLRLPVADHEETFVPAQPTNRLVDPWDVAATALWFASDDAPNVTGTVLTVDGGFTAR
ncbi:SDR family oxidoreductase [Streptomyces litchfieldiae]|uniref:SDR family oxidoreductase n=1 Tax=Streptomyces litchfieldiae TaxID=3075543 RepID=A0ABU2MR19_9ACTN|nr:SDR family oxidoreductase [Streptomyces sp. DSM 44938]MDT0343921.1 SDR family oxidoreductase [Streptomyces sp. DSM 44938]